MYTTYIHKNFSRRIPKNQLYMMINGFNLGSTDGLDQILIGGEVRASDLIYLLQIVIHVLSIVPYYMCVRMYGTMYVLLLHFKKERFVLNFLTPQNASKLAIHIEKENLCSFFRFSFPAILHFYIMNSLVYNDIDQRIHQEKNQLGFIFLKV